LCLKFEWIGENSAFECLCNKAGSETQEKPVGTFFYSIYYKNNFYNFRRVLKGPAFLKLRKLTYYITQDIKFIILDKKTP